MQPHELTAAAASRSLLDGEFTSEALVRSCLERISAREQEVGAWVHLDPDHALAQARDRDETPRRGALHGIPVGIKDIIDTVDMPTAQGSPIYEGFRPAADAACVALLREAGAVILGKTVTTEFAAMTQGKTRNPHNPAHSPGGSSSGSAASVADMMVPLALGTQTIGSTIRPAANCGVVGFKGSYGSFSLAGMKPQAPSMDALGLMARSVSDIALLRMALLGVHENTEFLARTPRIGICQSPHWSEAKAETVEAMSNAVAVLHNAGATTLNIELDSDFTKVLDAQWTILMFECSRCLRYELNTHANQLSDALNDLLEQGRSCPYSEYIAALDLAASCRARIAGVFKRVDVLLTPSAAGPAPLYGTPGDLLFQRLWTVLHLPCITLPAYATSAGLPIGVQLVSSLGDDRRLLAIAEWAEQNLGVANLI